jgi:glucan-binding YG repeat protein
MSDLYYYTSNVIGAIRGRLSIAESDNNLYVYSSGNGLSQTAEELIQNTIRSMASQKPRYAPSITQEARRLLLKWIRSGWVNFDGEDYLLDDTSDMRNLRVQERNEFAQRMGLD